MPPKNVPLSLVPKSDASKLSEVAQARISTVPLLRRRNQTKETKIPSHLKLSSDSRAALEAHLELIGIDYHHFSHTVLDQSMPFNRIYALTTDGLP
jgi:hypothetical protein